MERTLHLLEEFGDIVHRQSWTEIAKVAGADLE
jgi:hypothetical protein